MHLPRAQLAVKRNYVREQKRASIQLFPCRGLHIMIGAYIRMKPETLLEPHQQYMLNGLPPFMVMHISL